MSHLKLTVYAKTLPELSRKLFAIAENDIAEMDAGDTIGTENGWTLEARR
jgi:hypothetical protein